MLATLLAAKRLTGAFALGGVFLTSQLCIDGTVLQVGSPVSSCLKIDSGLACLKQDYSAVNSGEKFACYPSNIRAAML